MILHRGSSFSLLIGVNTVERLVISTGWQNGADPSRVVVAAVLLDKQGLHVQSEGVKLAGEDGTSAANVDLGLLWDEEEVDQIIILAGCVREGGTSCDFKSLRSLRVEVGDTDGGGASVAVCELSRSLPDRPTMELCRAYRRNGTGWWQFVMKAEPRDARHLPELVESYQYT